MKCIKCNAKLSQIDVALTKKFISRASTEYLCLDCLAKEFKVSHNILLEKAKQFKQTGCILFETVDI